MKKLWSRTHEVTRIRLHRVHEVGTFRGKSLICTRQRHIAIWIDEKDIQFDDDFIEFSINPHAKYIVSHLQKVLCDESYQSSAKSYRGLELLSLFEIEPLLVDKHR